MSPRDSHSTLAAACLVCAAACVGPPSGGEHDLSITANNLYVTSDGEVVVPELRQPLEVWSFSDGSWVSLEPLDVDAASAQVIAAPAGPIYVRYGTTWIATRAQTLELGTTRLGWPVPLEPPAGATLTLNVDGLRPWQSEDQLQLYAPGTALWSLSSPSIAADATSFVAEYDLSTVAWPRPADELWLMQMTTAALADTRYAALERSARLEVEGFGPEGIELDAPLVQEEPATFDVDYRIAEFDRVRLEEQALIASSWYDIGVAALDRAYAYGHFDVSADLAIARFDDHSGRDATGRMTFGDPFPPEWTRMATFVAWYPLTLDRTTVFDAVWTRDRAAAVSGRAIEPLVSAPRQVRFEGDRVRWLAPSRGSARGYRVRVYRIDEDGVSEAGTIATIDLEVRIPPGMLPAGVASAVQVTAIAGPMDLATAPFSLGLPYGEASITSSINRR